jgi:hypothetical protein
MDPGRSRALLVAAVKCKVSRPLRIDRTKNEYVRGQFQTQSIRASNTGVVRAYLDTRTSWLQQTALPAPRFRTRTF